MKIDIQAIVKNNVLENELLSISDIYDPKGLMSKYDNKVVVATLNLIVSKKGNFIALVDNINEI